MRFRSLRRLALAARAPPQQRGDALLVSEIFTSVQGEGPFTGRPSVFLRLGLCNLSCSWCDTPYTWLYTEERRAKLLAATPTSIHSQLPAVHDKGRELTKHSAQHTIDLVQRAATASGARGVRAVVITGGEPLLHVKPLMGVVRTLIDDLGLAVEFETNGTISPAGIHPKAHFNVSPKLANSHNAASTRINYAVLQQFAKRGAAFKFVIDEKDDIDEVLQIVDGVGVDAEQVFLMPKGTTHQQMASGGRGLVDICLQYGFRYSHRVHVELWGDKRGV